MSSPDVKPIIDEIVSDALTLSSLPATSAHYHNKLSPPYILRGQRPRPHVTLNLAQTLDGIMSVEAGPEALHLAHRLRSSHDAVLTMYGSELLEALDSNGSAFAGMKIIIDADLKTCDIQGDLRNCILICRPDLEGSRKAISLQGAGARLLFPISMEMPDVLETLYKAGGIRKVIVEGSLGSTFLTMPIIFDKIIITIIPKYTTSNSTSQNPVHVLNRPKLRNIQYEVLGSDIVLTAEPEY